MIISPAFREQNTINVLSLTIQERSSRRVSDSYSLTWFRFVIRIRQALFMANENTSSEVIVSPWIWSDSVYLEKFHNATAALAAAGRVVNVICSSLLHSSTRERVTSSPIKNRSSAKSVCEVIVMRWGCNRDTSLFFRGPSGRGNADAEDGKLLSIPFIAILCPYRCSELIYMR